MSPVLSVAVILLLLAGLGSARAQDEGASELSIERLIERGNELFGHRDIASARLLYELAASKGSARAAALLGATYDPENLKRLGIQGRFADAALAADFYRTALESGYAKASLALSRLTGEVGAEAAESQAAETPAESTQTAALPIFKPTPGGRFWVQLASLPNERDAGEERDRLQADLGDLIGDLDLVLKQRFPGGGRGIMYGVQSGPFGGRSEADAFCEALKARQQDCFVIQ